MKPITLKIMGLNSFEEQQTIDFEKLAAAKLFGIFGSTGSGKSTIIDAITLALYGEIARSDSLKSKKQFINANKQSAYVYFEFALHDKTYVIERSYKYKKNEATLSIIRFYEKGGNVIADKATDAKKQVEKIIGLEYKEFLRSVILPQGKFHEFLFLEGTERRKMLENIFDLELYGEALRSKVSEVYKKNYEKLESCRERLEELKCISEDEIESKKIQLEQKLELCKDLNNKLKSLSSEEEKLVSLNSALEELNTLFEQMIEHKSQQQYICKLEEDIKKSEIASKIKPIADEVLSIKERLENNIKSFEQQNNILDQLNIQNNKLSQKLEEARKLREQQQPVLIKKITDLQSVLKLDEQKQKVEKQLNTLMSSYSKCKTRSGNLDKEVKKSEDEIDPIVKKLESIKNRKIQIKVSYEYRTQVNDALNISKKILELEQSINKKQQLIKPELLEQISILEKEAEQKNALIKHLQMEQGAAFLAAQLSQGDTCPVCGSTILKNIAKLDQDFSKLLQKEQEELNQINKKLQEQKVNSEISKQTEQLLHSDYEQLKELKEALSNINLPACGIENIENISRQIINQDKELAKLETEQAKQEELILCKEKELRVKMQNQNEITTEMLILEANMENKKEEIKSLEHKIKEITGQPNYSIKELLDMAESELLSIKQNAENLESKFKKSQTELQLHQTSKATLNTTINILEETYAKQQQQLDLALHETEYSDANLVISFLLDNVEILRQNVKKHFEKESFIKNNIERVTEILNSKDFEINSENIKSKLADVSLNVWKLKNSILEINKKIKDTDKEAIILEANINDMIKKLETKKELEEKRKTLENKTNLLKQLDSLLKGGKFIKFVAQQHLKYVVFEASTRLMNMTANRYSIKTNSESDFLICDYMNGGKERSPKTLSGGEIFMTSLCLALALSSKVQLKNNAPLEFFFMDEGFGSLDEKRLNVVLNCLESLKHENMTIGVISHVEELKERIPSKLIVEEAVLGKCGTKVSYY